jgi:hypothetical protein
MNISSNNWDIWLYKKTLTNADADADTDADAGASTIALIFFEKSS